MSRGEARTVWGEARTRWGYYPIRAGTICMPRVVRIGMHGWGGWGRPPPRGTGSEDNMYLENCTRLDAWVGHAHPPY